MERELKFKYFILSKLEDSYYDDSDNQSKYDEFMLLMITNSVLNNLTCEKDINKVDKIILRQYLDIKSMLTDTELQYVYKDTEQVNIVLDKFKEFEILKSKKVMDVKESLRNMLVKLTERFEDIFVL